MSRDETEGERAQLNRPFHSRVSRQVPIVNCTPTYLGTIGKSLERDSSILLFYLYVSMYICVFFLERESLTYKIGK